MLAVGAARRLAWIVLIALMTQAGFSGNPRYIILGTSLLAVSAASASGASCSSPARPSRARPARPRLAIAAGIAAFAVLALATVHWAAPRFDNFDELDKALRYQAELRFDLRDALAKAGGAEAFKACGKATAGKFQRPARRLVPRRAHARRRARAGAAGRDRRRPHDEQAAPQAAAGAAVPARLRAGADGAHDDPVLDLPAGPARAGRHG